MLEALTQGLAQMTGGASGAADSSGAAAPAAGQSGQPSSLGGLFGALNTKFELLDGQKIQTFQQQQASVFMSLMEAGGPELQALLGVSTPTGTATAAAAAGTAGASAAPAASTGNAAAAATVAGAQAAAASPAAATAARTTAPASSTTTAQATATPTRQTVGTAPTAATRPTAPATRGYTPQSVHLAQFRGKYNTDGPTMAPNCGPTSVIMALRLAGLDIPGANGSRSQSVIDKARIMGTGRNDTSVGTTDTELERIITASGGRFSESQDINTWLGWARQGIPVVLSGNPGPAWNQRYSHDQIYHFNGAHWVTVSGYNSSTGKYIVNDPLSQIGAIEVSQAELIKYANGNGHLGIAVTK